MELKWLFILGISVAFCFIGYFAYKYGTDMSKLEKRTSELESEFQIIKKQGTTYEPSASIKFDSISCSEYNSTEKCSEKIEEIINKSDLSSIGKSLGYK